MERPREIGLAAPVAREKGAVSTYATLPRSAFLLSAALLAMRSAESFYTPILPLYVRVLDASIPLVLVGLATGIHRFGSAVINPLAGGWCDRIGSRKPFLVEVLLASLASLLGGLARGAPDLTLYRLLSGLGYGTLTIAALAYINQVTTLKNRATAMSLLSASTLAGAALGPLPGGYLAEAFTPVLLGYRATFFSGALVQLLVGGYAFLLIGKRGKAEAKAIPGQSHVLSYGAVLRNRDVLGTSLSAFLLGVSLGAFLYFTVPLLGDHLGFSPSRIGWIISAFGAGHVLGALFFGPLSDRMGQRKPFGFVAFFGLGALILVFTLFQSLPLMMAATFGVGLATAPACGIIPALVAELAPQTPATAIGVQKSAEQLGIFVGPVIGGVLIASAGYTVALITYGAITMVGSLVFLFSVSEPRKP